MANLKSVADVYLARVSDEDTAFLLQVEMKKSPIQLSTQKSISKPISRPSGPSKLNLSSNTNEDDVIEMSSSSSEDEDNSEDDSKPPPHYHL